MKKNVRNILLVVWVLVIVIGTPSFATMVGAAQKLIKKKLFRNMT
ncbi:hypothetical protein SAMN05216244_1390 [Sediminibacillus halophilus]|uniref:Uncharacterized protein n=1 Tax=Sediminibacillus halophilus TaxID=482461 RepID=A0A1G9PEG3_9BACI|nr:hypothetical protein SAMN05216244_1390 [Sediminibacillus halophilus]